MRAARRHKREWVDVVLERVLPAVLAADVVFDIVLMVIAARTGRVL